MLGELWSAGSTNLPPATNCMENKLSPCRAEQHSDVSSPSLPTVSSSVGNNKAFSGGHDESFQNPTCAVLCCADSSLTCVCLCFRSPLCRCESLFCLQKPLTLPSVAFNPAGSSLGWLSMCLLQGKQQCPAVSAGRVLLRPLELHVHILRSRGRGAEAAALVCAHKCTYVDGYTQTLASVLCFSPLEKLLLSQQQQLAQTEQWGSWQGCAGVVLRRLRFLGKRKVE